MKRWEKRESSSYGDSYILVFGYRMEEPKELACLFRCKDGWKITSDLVGALWTPLAPAGISAEEARNLAEKMVYEYYEKKRRYYQEICQEFEGG